MSDISPYTPPQSNVSAAEPEADIESLPVSDVWKKDLGGSEKRVGHLCLI